MQSSHRVRNAVLAQIVAGGHLSAKAIATEGNRHLLCIIWRRLNQHRDAQIGKAQGISNGALFTEIRQRDNDAVNAIAVLLEEIRAAMRVLA